MSAYIVSKRHIDMLVTVAFYGPQREIAVSPMGMWSKPNFIYITQDLNTQDMTPDDLGQLLWDENYRSVNARYNEDEKAPEYVFEPLERGKVPTIWQAYSGIDTYEYQACEADDWYTTPAFRFCVALKDKLVKFSAGYRETKWTEWS